MCKLLSFMTFCGDPLQTTGCMFTDIDLCVQMNERAAALHHSLRTVSPDSLCSEMICESLKNELNVKSGDFHCLFFLPCPQMPKQDENHQ